MKQLRSELQEHRVDAVEKNPRPVDANQKGRQKNTHFCNYCRTNGHTPSWCRKKIRDEGLKGIEKQRIAEKQTTFTQDYNKNEDQAMDQNNGLEARISEEETRTTLKMDLRENPPLLIIISL